MGAQVIEQETVVELVSGALVYRALRKYARSMATAGSQLGQVGVGHASSAALGAAATVAQKLQRSPVVERVLWLQEAGDVIRNVIAPAVARGSEPELTCERAEVLDVMFEFACKTRNGWQFDAKGPIKEARRLEHSECYREQFSLLVFELSEACAEDAAFRAWVEGTQSQ
jgi:hypothetical protein